MDGLILPAEIASKNEPHLMLHSNATSPLLNRTSPEFSLPDTEGDLVSLDDLRGTKVVLVFLRHFA